MPGLTVNPNVRTLSPAEKEFLQAIFEGPKTTRELAADGLGASLQQDAARPACAKLGLAVYQRHSPDRPPGELPDPEKALDEPTRWWITSSGRIACAFGYIPEKRLAGRKTAEEKTKTVVAKGKKAAARRRAARSRKL